ncbi:GABA(C) receptor [Intoshia linei]|uniref:GABA(C) receptor n=1 Tax=Intoshia linei TaxID=1819745 RepID=A0A177B0M4_9BILA|nr:GABA(C) receptor [Intoshia linei]
MKQYFTFFVYFLIKCIFSVDVINTNKIDKKKHVVLDSKWGNTDLFRNWIKKIEYNKYIPPSPKGEVLIVKISTFINSLGDINERDFDYTLNVFFRQIWIDKRLAGILDNSSLSSLAVTHDSHDALWLPDAFFDNSKMEYFHKITQPNAMIRIYNDGKIYFSQRLTLTLWCHLELGYYPMDKQECKFRIMAYKYNTRELQYEWHDGGSLHGLEEAKLSSDVFVLVNHTFYNCTTAYETGSYSCIGATLNFKRQFYYYLIQVYVPSILVVILSWISFWLDPQAVPGRISLGLLTSLAITTQMAGASSSVMPKVSYVKAIDVWLTSCMFFLFAAVVEFAIVNTIARREDEKAKVYKKLEKRRRKNVSAKSFVNNGYCSENENLNQRRRSHYGVVSGEHLQKRTVKTRDIECISSNVDTNFSKISMSGISQKSAPTKVNILKKLKKEYMKRLSVDTIDDIDSITYYFRNKIRKSVIIDKICRVLFPILFIIFNLTYWNIYITMPLINFS